LTEARDPYTSGHQERVATIAAAIAARLGHDAAFCDGIHVAGLVHDVGKIYVPAEILTKPRRLTDAEMAIIREHPRVGYEILKDVKFPWPIAEYVVHHHERLDGSGYPDHLAGDDISIGARILAVADVVEAMSSHRPYKTAAGLDKALEEIEDNAGRLYDSSVVNACLELFRSGDLVIPDVADSAVTI
jgi:putative nucleotidyltransferase with HDIG domain